MVTDNLNGGNSSTNSNSDSVLKDSPWGRLSEVTSLDNVSAGFASATGNQSGGAANSSSDSPYGGNPFANFGNPNASGNVFTGGTNPWASLNNSGSGSDTTSSNPFGGGNTSSSPVGSSVTTSSNSFGGGNTSSSPVGSSVTTSSNSFGGGNTSSIPVGNSGGSTSSSGSGNFGGIDFGSASQSVSFQDRVQTDQLVNSSLSENGVSVPTTNISFIGNFGGTSSVGGSNSDGASPVGTGNGSGSSNPFDPGFDPSSSGSNSSSASPVSGSNSNSVAQVSPFDQLQQNLDDYFKPFSNGGTPDASQFGDPSKINPFNANLSGSNSSDDTRNSLLGSIDTTNTDTLGAQIGDKVVNMANSYTNGTPTVDGGMPTVDGRTPTVNGTALIAVDNTPSGNNSVFPQLASNDGSNLAQTSPIADTFGQNQNQGGNFIGGSSNDGNSVFSGGSGNTQDYSDQMAYYQGLTSKFQQNPQEANNGLVGDNQFSGGSNPFGGSSSNPFGGGGSPFGA